MNHNILPVFLAADIDKQPQEENWLIKHIWTNMAVGIIGGAPKCCKSWFGLDMAISIASGTPCLDHFPIQYKKGPVLIYLAEDALGSVRSRIESICQHRKLKIEHLPIYAIASPVLRLDIESDRQRLMKTIDKLKPKMLLLDPLVRMHRLDENSAQDISGLLGYLREMQRKFNLAVVLVHHSSKKNRSNPGQALRGSSDLHAFGDSNAYLIRKNDKLILTVEHRAAPCPEPFSLQLVTKPDGKHTHLRVFNKSLPDNSSSTNNLDQIIFELLDRCNSPLYKKDIRKHLKVNNQRLGQVLAGMEKQGMIEKTKSGWKKVVSKTVTDSKNQKQSVQLQLPI